MYICIQGNCFMFMEIKDLIHRLTNRLTFLVLFYTDSFQDLFRLRSLADKTRYNKIPEASIPLGNITPLPWLKQ